MFPIGDYPNPRGIHWMTLLLIVANVAVFALVTLPMSVQPVSPADPRRDRSSRAGSDPLRDSFGCLISSFVGVFF